MLVTKSMDDIGNELCSMDGDGIQELLYGIREV